MWLLDEVPAKVREHLNLPATDQGIDLIAQARNGEFWAIQCKYRDSDESSLTWREVSTFAGLSFGVARNIAFGLIAYSGERYTDVLKEGEHVGFLTSEAWHGLDRDFFDRARALLAHHPKPLAPYAPRPHQARAIEAAVTHFKEKQETRGKLIMPCGSGKSFTAFWVAEALDARTILVAVPSLSLMRQTLKVWLREFAAHRKAADIEWLCVCSDATVGSIERDDAAVHVQDLGVPCVTDTASIGRWLSGKSIAKRRVVFSTYQSGKAIAEAARECGARFDLGIFDEAHETVGDREGLFAHLLFDEHIAIDKRLFMTATERRYAGQGDTVLSMDNPAVYGETFELLSFKEALEQQPPILSDYRILTMVVSAEEVQKLIEQNLFVRPDRGKWDSEIEAQQLAALVALRRAMEKYPIRHAVSFHSSIARARAFKDSNDRFSEALSDFGSLETFHVTGATPTSLREREVREFARADRSLITNARCLTEGVDVPGIDCVLFADPKGSTIDIVQAVGRALRPSAGKEHGYIIVPVLAKGTDAVALVESNAFSHVLAVLRALAANDERIIEFFQEIAAGKRPKAGTLISAEVDARIAEKININEFIRSLELKTWSRIARLAWQPYDEAVEFVHSLGLASKAHWQSYCFGERFDLLKKPPDIPNAPPMVYGKEFVVKGGWGAWLGTGYIAHQNRKYLSYDDAIKFVHLLHLTNYSEWRKYCKGQLPALIPKPENIPATPYRVYGDEFKLKGGIGGWLGSGRVANQFRQFKPYGKAMKFVHSLGLKSQIEWGQYVRGEMPDLIPKPDDIPGSPLSVYGKEFTKIGGWGAWLGTGNRKGGWLTYDDAAKFVHNLGLKNHFEWRAYCRGDRPDLPQKPSNVPGDPLHLYTSEFKEKGGWSAWVGAFNRIGRKGVRWRPYDVAVKFVHGLKLKSEPEWRAYCRGDFPDLPVLPDDIPRAPYGRYQNFKEKGGWSAWLGTKTKKSLR